MKALGWRTVLLTIIVVEACYLPLVLADAPAWAQRMPLHFAAIIGGVAAALAFGRKDPPRRPWLLLGLSPLLGVFAGFAIHAELRGGNVPLAPIAIVLANIMWVLAVYGLLRVVKTSGLAPVWSHRSRAFAVVAIVLSVALMAPTFIDVTDGAGPQTTAQWAWASRRIAGVVADALVFNLAVQIVRITYAMRGGAIAQAYLLLAGSAIVLLLVGLSLALTQNVMQLDLSLGLRVVDGLGWSLMGLAGWSQRMVLVRLRKRLS